MTKKEDDQQTDEQKQQEKENNLVAFHIGSLRRDPIQGNFDIAHLKAIHAYIFQDLPHHQPGVTRRDTQNWVKHRALEDSTIRYDVGYASDNVKERINIILEKFGGPKSLEGLSVHDAAQRLAKLYGDLDHAHGFYEGNSRTLREFTRELASVEKSGDKAPDFRIYTGKAEIGAAWSSKSKEGKPYISVKLDDPSFAAPILCRLVESDKGHNLVWTRQ